MKTPALPLILLACAGTAHAQLNRSQDWSTFGSDIGRTGLERSDPLIQKETLAKDFTLLYKMKLASGANRAVTPPVVIAILISYRGFKELAFSASSNNTVHAINADFGKIFWEKPLIYSSEIPEANDSWLPCSSTIAPLLSLVPPPVLSGRGRGAASSTPALPPGRGLGGAGFGATRPVLSLGSDGRLHRLNAANGDDLGGVPVRFLPPNARASALNVSDNVVYTSTNQGCGAVPNAIWAIDFAPETPAVTSFQTNGGGVWGIGGVAMGPDRTVYAQLGDGPFDPAANKWSNVLLALAPRTLEVKQYFRPPDLAPAKNIGMNSATPAVFTWKDRTLVAATGRDGRVYLLDGELMGGADHNTSLSKSAVLSDGATPERGIYGLASFTDEQETRWVLASVWGPVAGSPSNPNGGVVAFKVEEKEGMPVLTRSWVSRDLSSPVPPVSTNGVVFALGAGDYTRTPKHTYEGIPTVEEKPKPNARATLLALDAATGKEIWSSRQQVPVPAALTGLTVANGHVYFGATDGTLYCFGIPIER